MNARITIGNATILRLLMGANVNITGQNGLTPYIGSNGNWWIGITDTGFKVVGNDGLTPYIKNGNWWIGEIDTGVAADAQPWTPIFSLAMDGSRYVQKLTSYVGGSGAAPTANIGQYLKSDGTFTSVITEAATYTNAEALSSKVDKGGSDKTLKQVEDEIVQLAGSTNEQITLVEQNINSVQREVEEGLIVISQEVKEKFPITVNDLAESTKQYIEASGGAEITNFPDEEDITVNEINQLQLRDKTFSPATFSGRGRKYMRKKNIGGKNVLTQDMLSDSDTIYQIQYDYDLNNETIILPDNSVIKIDGGSIRNGTIDLNGAYIDTQKIAVFQNVEFVGNIKNSSVYAAWFVNDDSFASFLHNVRGYINVFFETKEYNINNSIEMEGNVNLVGNDAVINSNISEGYLFTINPYKALQIAATLTKEVKKGDRNLSVQDTSGINKGDLLILRDLTTSSFSIWRDYQQGEIVCVESINEQTIKLVSPIYGDYTNIANCRVYKPDFRVVHISDLTINYLGGKIANRGAIRTFSTKNSLIENIKINGADIGIITYLNYNSTVQNCIVNNTTEFTGDSYAVSISNSQNVNVYKCVLSSGNHGITVGGTYEEDYSIINRFITIEDCSCVSTKDGFPVGIDAHGNIEFFNVKGCRAKGVLARGDYTRIEDCLFHDIGILLSERTGFNLAVTGCRFINTSMLLYNYSYPESELKNDHGSINLSGNYVENSGIAFSIGLSDVTQDMSGVKIILTKNVIRGLGEAGSNFIACNNRLEYIIENNTLENITIQCRAAKSILIKGNIIKSNNTIIQFIESSIYSKGKQIQYVNIEDNVFSLNFSEIKYNAINFNFPVFDESNETEYLINTAVLKNNSFYSSHDEITSSGNVYYIFASFKRIDNMIVRDNIFQTVAASNIHPVSLNVRKLMIGLFNVLDKYAEGAELSPRISLTADLISLGHIPNINENYPTRNISLILKGDVPGSYSMLLDPYKMWYGMPILNRLNASGGKIYNNNSIPQVDSNNIDEGLYRTLCYDSANKKYFITDYSTSGEIKDINGFNIMLAKGTTSNRPVPASSDAGFQYFDTTLNKPIYWTGSGWIDATGVTV